MNISGESSIMSSISETPVVLRRASKRRAAAISIPDEEKDSPVFPIEFAPLAKRKRSRIFAIVTDNREGSPDVVRPPTAINVSPIRLGNLPIPRIDFENSDYSSDEETQEEPLFWQGYPEMNNNQVPAIGYTTPRREVTNLPRDIFGCSSFHTPQRHPLRRSTRLRDLRVSIDVVSRKTDGAAAPIRPTYQRRNVKNGLRKRNISKTLASPSVRDVAALFQML